MESRFINGVRCRHGLRVPDRTPGVRFDHVVILGVRNENINNYRVDPDAARYGSGPRDPRTVRDSADL